MRRIQDQICIENRKADPVVRERKSVSTDENKALEYSFDKFFLE